MPLASLPLKPPHWRIIRRVTGAAKGLRGHEHCLHQDTTQNPRRCWPPSPPDTSAFGHIVAARRLPQQAPPPPSRARTPAGSLLNTCTRDSAHRGGRRGGSREHQNTFPKAEQDQLRTCPRYSLLFLYTPALAPPTALHHQRGGVSCVLRQLSERVGGSSVILPANTGHWSNFTQLWTKMAENLSAHAPSFPVHDVNKGTSEDSPACLSPSPLAKPL